MKKTTFGISTLALIAALAGASAGWSQDTATQPEAGAPAGATEPMDVPMRGGKGPRGLDFATMDANGDGMITQEEVQAMKAARFTRMDTNGDGNLSSEELIADMEKMRSERMASRIGTMIETFDKNGDGLLSAEEIPADRGEGRMFEKLDTDDDGAISKAEADAGVAKMGRGDHGGKHDGKRGGKHGGGHGGDHGDRKGGFWGMFGQGPDAETDGGAGN